MGRELNEGTALLDNKDEEQKKLSCIIKLKNTTAFKASMFGLNGLFFAGHLVINGKFLTLLAPQGSSASSSVSAFSSVVLGGAVGLVLSTGLNVGPLVGQKKLKQAGEIAKTAFVLSISVGVISSALMLATREIFPHIFDKSSAKIASDFLSGYSIGVAPLMLSVEGLQIAFINGDWFVPPLSMGMLCFAAGGMSYLLGFKTNLGALGIGLGGSVGNTIVAALMALWLARSKYKKYEFYSLGIEQFREKMKTLLGDGWKLAFQRLTEWLNLFLITILIGIKSNSELGALNAAILSQVLFGVASQSFGQAVGMLTSQNYGAMKNLEIDLVANNSDLIKHHKSNIKIVAWGTLCALSTNAAISTALFLARKPLAEMFSADKNENALELTQTLLWINAIGLVFDSLRITLSGALRGWKDLLVPSVISFVLMTVIGVTVGYGISFGIGHSESEIMLWSRDISIFLTSVLIGVRTFKQIKSDHEQYRLSAQAMKNEAEDLEINNINFNNKNNSKLSGWYSFFNAKHTPVEHNEIQPPSKRCQCTIL